MSSTFFPFFRALFTYEGRKYQSHARQKNMVKSYLILKTAIGAEMILYHWFANNTLSASTNNFIDYPEKKVIMLPTRIIGANIRKPTEQVGM